VASISIENFKPKSHLFGVRRYIMLPIHDLPIGYLLVIERFSLLSLTTYLRIGFYIFDDIFSGREVNVVEQVSRWFGHFIQQAVGTAVYIGTAQNMLPRRQQIDHRRNGCHSGTIN